LEQVNSKEGPDWKVWDQPNDYPSQGFRAFWAAEAARTQGDEAFERYHFKLLDVKHIEKADIADLKVLSDAAESAGLDVVRFKNDMTDRRLLSRLVEDHTYAQTLGIFGTPTLVFPNKKAVFVKISETPSAADGSTFFQEVWNVANRPFVQELTWPNP
jgi:predicted DsbA family dithiol-disulfide isomerase